MRHPRKYYKSTPGIPGVDQGSMSWKSSAKTMYVHLYSTLVKTVCTQTKLQFWKIRTCTMHLPVGTYSQNKLLTHFYSLFVEKFHSSKKSRNFKTSHPHTLFYIYWMLTDTSFHISTIFAFEILWVYHLKIPARQYLTWTCKRTFLCVLTLWGGPRWQGRRTGAASRGGSAGPTRTCPDQNTALYVHQDHKSI
jgi:hypothetical protein